MKARGPKAKIKTTGALTAASAIAEVKALAERLGGVETLKPLINCIQ